MRAYSPPFSAANMRVIRPRMAQQPKGGVKYKNLTFCLSLKA